MTRTCGIFAFASLAAAASASAAAAPRSMTVSDLITTVRVGSPTLSPDGRQVIYSLTTTHPESSSRVAHLWVIPLDGSAPPRQLTGGDKGESDPAISPDGRQLAFIADRSGTPQVHLMPLDGGEARRLTSLATGVQGPLRWSPDGSRIAFVSDVFPPCTTDACNKQRQEASTAPLAPSFGIARADRCARR
jgi:Tol biopolymer transport system component